mgnify:CR=1 FL=1
MAARTIPCPRCGYPAQWPATLVCNLCGELLVKKQEEPPPAAPEEPAHPHFPDSLVRKLEAKQLELEERRRVYRDWLRRQRRYHAASGAVLFAIGNALAQLANPGAPSTLLGFLVLLVVDLALGAGCGLALNRYEGGRFQGAALFLGGFLLHLPTLAFSSGAGGLLAPLLYLFCGALASMALGGMLGASLESDHAEKGMS